MACRRRYSSISPWRAAAIMAVARFVARLFPARFGAVIEDLGGGKVAIGKPGVLVGNEIAELVNAGYQMFLRTPAGRECPALAPHLKTLHAFDEDLREAEENLAAPGRRP